jgi:hypothetical protein
MNLHLVSFASIGVSTVQSVVCLGYGSADREIWAVFLGSNREGLSLLHGVDLGWAALSVLPNVFAGFSVHLKMNPRPMYLRRFRICYLLRPTPPPPPRVKLVKHNNKLVFSVVLYEWTERN